MWGLVLSPEIENALVGYDESSFWKIVAIYAFCLVLALPIRAIQSYLIPKVGLMWRRWLSSRLLGRYFIESCLLRSEPE